MRYMKWQLASGLLASLALAVSGCGGTSTPLTPAPGAPARLALPAPSQLPSRSANFTLAEGYADGADFDALKPNNRASVAGTTAVFAPDFTAAATNSSAGLAYAVYDFHLPNYAGALADIEFSWTDHPLPGSLYIGLGDFITDRWVWTKDPALDTMHFSSIPQYLNAADHLYLAVATAGTNASILTSIQISEQQAPTAVLISDVDSGQPPLTVTFDASGSTDADGTIDMIEWDFNGDSNFTQTVEEVAAFNDLTPAPVDYGVIGVYDVQVRITDNDGLTDLAQLQINVTNNPAPVADLAATPATTGPKPLNVDFDATGSTDDGTIAMIEWDFDGDNNFNEIGNNELAAQNDATPPTYIYDYVDVFTAQVRVTDNLGASDVAQLVITTTNTPPIADIAAPVPFGPAPRTMSFDGSGSDDPGGSLNDYEWDLDNDGTFNEPGDEATAHGQFAAMNVLYTDPGFYTVTLRVTDDDGATDTTTATFTATGWKVITVESGPGVDAGYWGDITLVNGNPAMAFRGGTGGNNTITYAYSSTATGSQASDWTKVTVPTPGIGVAGREISIATIGGNPAISYADGSANADLVYQRATTTTGVQATDWINPVIVQSTNDAGYASELLEVNGRPAIAFDDSTAGDLKYAHSVDADGDLAIDWLTNISIDTATGGGAGGCSLALVGGNPAVSYYYWDGAMSHLTYCRSSTAAGDAVGNWSTKTNIGPNNTSPNGMELAMVGANPAIVFQDNATSAVSFVRATNATGGTWPAGFITVQAAMGGSYASLCMVGGNPAAAYFDNTTGFDAIYTRSTQADGSSGWTTHETVAGAGQQGRYCTMIMVDGGTKPAMYFRDDGNQSAKYAVKF